jgi:ribose/xylose/arabinose/galactoside ABC-type transport system permease subunit
MKTTINSVLKKIFETKQIGLIIAIIALSVVMTIINPEFISLDNLRDILLNISIITIAGVGISLVILTGEIDISIGSQLAVAATVSALFVETGGNPLLSVVIAIAVGAFLGFINGFLIYKTGMHSIIITLGTMTILRGLNILIMRGKWITDLPNNFWLLGNFRILQIPLPVWVMFFCVAVATILIKRTSLGREIYLTGDNIEAARISGVQVGKVKILVFMILGAVVGLAAVLKAARFGWVMTNMGQGFEFEVIGAAVVGGISIFGGVGSIIGMFLGSILMGIIPNALVLIRVPTTWERTILGLLILFAVSSDAILKNRRKKIKE